MGTSWGADFDKGLDAWQSRDFATALRELKPLAEQGDAEAQMLLGLMYDEGQGVPKDGKTALKWFTLAAEQGESDSQAVVGASYYDGHSVPKNYETALKWFTLAAEQGNSQSCLTSAPMEHS